LAFLVARDKNGQRGRRPSWAVVAGIVGVMIPAVLPTATENISAFIENVVRFPLGLAGVSSPAASPLIGHLVVSLFPGIHRIFTGVVAVLGVLVLGYVLARRRPKSPAALARLVGWIMTVAILLAPATRVGYLLYPVDFFVWAWLLRSEDTVDPPPEDPRRMPEPAPDEEEPSGPDGSFAEPGTTGRGAPDHSDVLTSACTRSGSGAVGHGVQP
jgi:hypothetical protein